MTVWRNQGVLAALVAALLFGAGTPIAKLLLGQTSPWLLASLPYLGPGIWLLASLGVNHMAKLNSHQQFPITS